jgi:hypothetical protein
LEENKTIFPDPVCDSIIKDLVELEEKEERFFLLFDRTSFL